MSSRRFALSPQQKADARDALRILEGTGLTLADAARRSVAGRQALVHVSFKTAADRFLLQLVREKARGATVRWYENKLAPMLDALGERLMDDIARSDLISAAEAQTGVEDSTRSSYFRAVRAVWRWSLTQEPPLVGADVTAGLPTTSKRNHDQAPGFLAVDDVANILTGSGRHASALALMLFAGLRPQELWGIDKPPLLWKNVLTSERIVRVPAEVAKTRKARLLEGLPGALWHWLQPRGPDQSVAFGGSQQIIRIAQRAAGFAKFADGQHVTVRAWPHDATRHSFATYALALTGDPGRVALWLGHEGSPRLLYTNYRGLATKAEAEKYFGLVPPQLRALRSQFLGAILARPRPPKRPTRRARR